MLEISVSFGEWKNNVGNRTPYSTCQSSVLSPSYILSSRQSHLYLTAGGHMAGFMHIKACRTTHFNACQSEHCSLAWRPCIPILYAFFPLSHIISSSGAALTITVWLHTHKRSTVFAVTFFCINVLKVVIDRINLFPWRYMYIYIYMSA